MGKVEILYNQKRYLYNAEFNQKNYSFQKLLKDIKYRIPEFSQTLHIIKYHNPENFYENYQLLQDDLNFNKIKETFQNQQNKILTLIIQDQKPKNNQLYEIQESINDDHSHSYSKDLDQSLNMLQEFQAYQGNKIGYQSDTNSQLSRIPKKLNHLNMSIESQADSINNILNQTSVGYQNKFQFDFYSDDNNLNSNLIQKNDITSMKLNKQSQIDCPQCTQVKIQINEEIKQSNLKVNDKECQYCFGNKKIIYNEEIIDAELQIQDKLITLFPQFKSILQQKQQEEISYYKKEQESVQIIQKQKNKSSIIQHKELKESIKKNNLIQYYKEDMQTLNSQLYFQENIQDQLENKENQILLQINSNNNNDKQNQNQIQLQNEDPKKQNNNKILKLEDLEQQVQIKAKKLALKAKVIKQSDQILKRIQPLQKYKLIVEIKNNGKESWPEETYIKCISGYKEGEKKKLGKVESQDIIQVQFTDTAPADCEKHLISWRMFYKNINGEEDQFGPRIQYQIIVQDNTQIL